MVETHDSRGFAPATVRNRDPILGVLARVIPAGANVLEIASGTGEHAVYFAARLPGVTWQPSDPTEGARASIDAWRSHAVVDNVAPALELDVNARPWSVGRFDAIVCINMIHIAPWSSCEALLAEAPSHLAPRGVLCLYGPYLRGGAHTAESNEAFDRSLRARNPEWGVRDLDEVVQLANKRGFRLDEVVEMPANNLSVVLRLR
jgi:cyclopropane fatty-acyl-phospholipid synthase-like methyltransferase